MAFGSGNNSNATTSGKQLTSSSSSSTSTAAQQQHLVHDQSHVHNHHVHPHHHHPHHHHHHHQQHVHPQQQQHHGGVVAPPQLSSTPSMSSVKGSVSSNTYSNIGCFPNDTQQQQQSTSSTLSSGQPPPLPPHHHHHSGSVSSFVKPEFGGEKRVVATTAVQQGTVPHQYNQAHHLYLQQQQQHRDLTPGERRLLDQIRARKAELLKEIAQLQDEIDSVSRELVFTKEPSSQTLPAEPDLLLSGGVRAATAAAESSGGGVVVEPPLADVELDNLSEHSNEQDGGRIASGSSALSVSGSTKDKDRLKIMSLGCKKFNMDPKKGIEFLVLNSLLNKDDDMDMAHFLYRGEGLNKTAIGDYLGEKSEFNERVLKAFVGLHDFTDLILVQALRQFLWSFRLPGEAQKIDRMMECFAQRYCQNNPDIFTNTDTCYVLSFAIIMLNTSLHNPSVKDKPSVDTFISMNRGINNGGDLPRELLISLYNSIQSEPFKIPEDDGNDLMHTFFNPDKEGWLWKQGGRYKTWKRRWFILNDNCLYYFEFTTDKEPRGIIPLENVGVREIDDSKSKQKYCFELYATDDSHVIKACKTDSDGRVVEGKHSVYRMSAASAEERDSWVKALRQSISYSPFYEILRKSGGGPGNSTSSLRTGGL